MRRTAIAAFGFLLAGCSTPPISLQPRFALGQQRTYRLTAVATTALDLGGLQRTERTRLVARSMIEVLEIRGEETTLRLTVTPERFEQDGRAASPPSEQQVELVAGPDGGVRRITKIGGLEAGVAGADVEELAPLLGAPLPTGRVRLGQRWRRAFPPLIVEAPGGAPQQLPPGTQRGRLAALRVVRDFDCAIVRLGTERPLVRERDLGEQPVRLTGTEFSSTEMAFAFRQGFPVELRTTAQARFGASSAGFAGGSVMIESDTTLELLSPRA